ncbi:MAG: molybdate ABC transporter substrate-binding protein [Campylobacterota bacterium]|nr:molybdate ABC transporter substrate-binding protein [Campylobacterota bacterium]
MKLKLWMLVLLFFTHTIIQASTIKLAVAANVSYAMDDLKKAFNKQYPDTKVLVTLGGSGKLVAQINHGAPYQLFMSANMMYPEALYKTGIATSKPTVYAQGSLAYFSAKVQDFRQEMQLTKATKIRKIAIANPKTAPYGKATVEALQKAGVYAEVKHKFVYGESIAQTVSYAVTAADLGFIAKSSLYSLKMSQYQEGVHWAEVNATLYTPIKQGMVLLRRAKGNEEVKAFYDFMLSQTAQKILQDFGYQIP